MTSTARGPGGASFGYLHRSVIIEGRPQPHMTVVGGEDRFWLGPEGGQFALYFPPGATFETESWQVPAAFDWGAWPVVSQSSRDVSFSQPMSLVNYARARFDLRVDRTVRLLEGEAVSKALGVTPDPGVDVVAFESENTVTNTGANTWSKPSGLVSIWMLGMGGFVAGPGGVAAWLTRRPLVLHEQNSVAGTTNRVLAPLAARIFASFPDSFPARVRAEVVGNPVRSSIATADAPRERLGARRAERRRLFIIGGSQGARALNRALPQALAELPREQRPEVWHQAGRLGVEETRAAYAAANVEARVDAFVDDIAGAFRWADLVVARAGASTLAEVAAVGVGAILVPLPTAIDDHQTMNARHYTAGGAALAIAEKDLDPKSLAQALAGCLGDLGRLIAMAEGARGEARFDAADRIARACVELAEAHR
jgi:UDP-N-acetylglucosamine--N-acetylmuramyl-(pentapeptide) pyrophosphoryl-undecaprenol N-acetylglucosamine transferase